MESSEHVTFVRSFRWIRMPSGTTLRLARSRLCRKAVAALVEQRVRAPGCPIPSRTLASALWKGTKRYDDETRKRLREVMRRLRLAGLDEILIRLDAGYLLNPTIPVHRA
jgi:hypothetical protein